MVFNVLPLFYLLCFWFYLVGWFLISFFGFTNALFGCYEIRGKVQESEIFRCFWFPRIRQI
jgi:hypothetical protein